MLLRFFCAALVLVVACGDDATSSGGAPEGGAGQGGQAEGAGGAGGAAGSSDLSLLTWNLEHFPKSDSTIAQVEEVLTELGPDLVTLQEISEEADWQTLDGTLEDYEGVLATSGDGFVRVGMLYRPDRVTVTDARMVFEDDDFAFPRAMLVVNVERKDDPEQDFLLGVVHLKALLDEESTARRRAACIALDTWMTQQISGGIEREIVIAGDFNDQLTDTQQWNVFGPLLQARDGGFLTLAAEQAGEYSYIPFTSFLDHVLVRGGGLVTGSSANPVPLDLSRPGYVTDVSDHRPVLATLRFGN